MSQSTIERTGIAFRLQRRFAKPREIIFRAWTDPEALKRWWCPEGWVPELMEVDLRVGASYRMGMCRRSGGAPVFVHGSFLEIQAPEKLVYTWKWENAFEQMPETRVSVEFIAEGAGTIVVLQHEYLPEVSVCLQHRSGWIAAWDRLERTL
jgi:uncharacterized protein YndB with AHSA1/START domain